MEQILIISGKGGTGKTILTSSLASLVENKILVDCDVDADNLHILLNPEIEERYNFLGGKKPIFLEDKCNLCGKCVKLCVFSALSLNVAPKFNYMKYPAKPQLIYDAFSCEGCGVCSWNCPSGAISMQEEIVGEWFISKTKYGTLVHAKLGVAQENSGKLVSTVRKSAFQLGNKNDIDYVLIDGPPGIGCPVISSITGVDKVIIITEPSVSGIHDLKRVLKLVNHFQIENVFCVINRFNINLDMTQNIEKYCNDRNVKIIGKLPYERKVVECMAQKKIITEEYKNSPFSIEIMNIWNSNFRKN